MVFLFFGGGRGTSTKYHLILNESIEMNNGYVSIVGGDCESNSGRRKVPQRIIFTPDGRDDGGEQTARSGALPQRVLYVFADATATESRNVLQNAGQSGDSSSAGNHIERRRSTHQIGID